MTNAGKDRTDLEIVFADKVPARIITASAGLLIGGPIGAVVGAAAAPIVEHFLGVGNRRFINNAERVVDAAAELAGVPPGGLVPYATGTRDRERLLVDAIRAASDTMDEDKLRALARILATGLVDDAHLEMCSVYIRAVRDLESYHVRVLHFVEVESVSGQFIGAPSETFPQAFPGLAAGMDNIVSTLEREGLIEQDLVKRRADTRDILEAEMEGGFVITPFGTQVLAWLRSDVYSDRA